MRKARGKSLNTNAVDNVGLLLRRWSEGDKSALEELTPLVYDELHGLALNKCDETKVSRTYTVDRHCQLVSTSRVLINARLHFQSPD
jgi:hypothetical protein